MRRHWRVDPLRTACVEHREPREGRPQTMHGLAATGYTQRGAVGVPLDCARLEPRKTRHQDRTP